MGKKIAKMLGNDFHYYGYGLYLGHYNDFDVTVKYDDTSMLYNLNLNVTGSKDMNKLNDTLEKIDKNAVAKYKNCSLTISQYCETLKEMPQKANQILAVVTEYLKKNKYQNICKYCDKPNKTSLVNSDGNVSFYCDDCFEKEINRYQNEIKQNKKVKENIGYGLIGSIIGCIPGIITLFILSYLKINSAFAALIIMLGSAYGYKWLGNSMKISGLIISLVVGFGAIIFANELSNAYNLYVEYNSVYNINLYDAYKAIPYYIAHSASFKSSYIQSLIVAIVFGIFGGLSNLSIYRKFLSITKIKKIEVSHE
jgi:hypothetical protein